MSDVVIFMEGIGKQYLLGSERESYYTLREALMNTIRNPLSRLRRLSGKLDSDRQTFWALKEISFEVHQGDVLGVIGRNGAGKSTLLKILSRITEPTTGRARVYGPVGSLLEVGTGFHPELTGRENIYLNGAVLGMKRREISKKFDAIVDFSGIEKFLHTPVKRYSSGMYVRLAFSLAAHLEPEVLLVDEVLAVGDAEFQKKCLGKMQDVARSGRTVLFVSHNMNAIERLCNRGLLLENGTAKGLSNDVRSLIKSYLAGTDGTEHLSEWVNRSPESLRNRWFVPETFFVSDGEGNKLTAPVSNNEEIWITIEIELMKIDPALTLGYALYLSDGTLLYWSYQTDDPECTWAKLRKGQCVLKSRIPPRLLNEGDYRIEMIASIHFAEWLLEPGTNAPFVSFSIRGGLSDSPYWIAKRPGILGPVMRWFCEQ